MVNGTEARYYINDHLGTTELVAGSDGQVISDIQHSAFGDAAQIITKTVTFDKQVANADVSILIVRLL